jgi:hypothetical protein
MTFSATDAALEGFKITRGRPAAVLAWAGAFLALPFVVHALAIVVIGGPRLEAWAELKPFATPTQEQVTKLWPIIFETALIGALVSLPVLGLLYASIDRAVLRPDEGAFAWLALGADEARQIAVLFCYALVQSATLLGGFIGATILLGLPLSFLGAPGAFIATFFGAFAALALTAWVGVRLSLGPPATFDQRRFVLFESWAMTRGRFWELLGCYVIAWLFSMLVWVLVDGLGMMIIASLPGPDPAPVPASFAALFSPKVVIDAVFAAAASALALPLRVAPAAYAYREIARTTDKASTFA